MGKIWELLTSFLCLFCFTFSVDPFWIQQHSEQLACGKHKAPNPSVWHYPCTEQSPHRCKWVEAAIDSSSIASRLLSHLLSFCCQIQCWDADVGTLAAPFPVPLPSSPLSSVHRGGEIWSEIPGLMAPFLLMRLYSLPVPCPFLECFWQSFPTSVLNHHSDTFH